jgi:hypothetical protein
MLAVTEPQVWTMIAVFTALMSGMLTVVSTLFIRVLRTEIGGLRTEIGGLRTELRGEIQGLRTEVTGQIHALDRDVQALMRHTFGIDRS